MQVKVDARCSLLRYRLLLPHKSELVQLHEHFGRERNVLVLALKLEAFEEQVEERLECIGKAEFFDKLRVLGHVELAVGGEELLHPRLRQRVLQLDVLLVAQIDQVGHELRQLDTDASRQAVRVLVSVHARLHFLLGQIHWSSLALRLP